MIQASTKQKVLLIGWDAADWEHITPLLEEGLMPIRQADTDEEIASATGTPLASW